MSLTRLPALNEASASIANRSGLREDDLIGHHTRLLSGSQQIGCYYTPNTRIVKFICSRLHTANACDVHLMRRQ